MTGEVRITGTSILITGTVSSLDGRPVEGARVAISEVDSSLDEIRCPAGAPSALAALAETLFTFTNAIEDIIFGFFGQTPERLETCSGGATARSDRLGKFSVVIKRRVGAAYLGFGVVAGKSLTSFRLREQTQRLARLEVLGGTVGRVEVQGSKASVTTDPLPWPHDIDTQVMVGNRSVMLKRHVSAFDARPIEDFPATATVAVSTQASLPPGLTEVQFTGAPTTIAGRGHSPPSRGLPCAVSYYSGRTRTFDPCPATDGSLRTSIVEGADPDEGVGDPAQLLIIELPRPVPLAAIAMWGCDHACTVSVSKDGKQFDEVVTGSDVTLEGFDEPLHQILDPGGTLPPSRSIRVELPEGLSEFSVWY